MMIHNHFVKVLFPFHYSGNGNESLKNAVIVNRKGKAIPVFEQFGFDHLGFRNGLSGMFSSEKGSAGIVDCFRITYNSRDALGLPRKKNESLHFYCRAKGTEGYYEVAVEDICLYLFESGVGFVELEVSYPSREIKDYMDCNYFLCEVKSDRNYFVSQLKSWNESEKKEEITEEKFTVKELLWKVLSYVTGTTDFYTTKPWIETQEKGLVYSYLYLNDEPENLRGTLFNIRNNYKQSYKAPDAYENIRDDSHVRKMFENSYWCASYNAAVNVSIKTEDLHTNDFFENEFGASMHSSYYCLFLAVLHQRFSIIQLLAKLDKMDNFELGYEAMKEQLQQAQEFQTEATKLRVRDFFKLPSYTEHINNYYEFLCEVYRVDELYAALSADLDNLERVCSVYVDKINAREERNKKYRSAKIEIFVGIFGTIVGAIGLFNDSWQLLERIFGGNVNSFPLLVIFVTLFLWVPSTLVVINSVKKIREMKRIRIENGEEDKKAKDKKKKM